MKNCLFLVVFYAVIESNLFLISKCVILIPNLSLTPEIGEATYLDALQKSSMNYISPKVFCVSTYCHRPYRIVDNYDWPTASDDDSPPY